MSWNGKIAAEEYEQSKKVAHQIIEVLKKGNLNVRQAKLSLEIVLDEVDKAANDMKVADTPILLDEVYQLQE
ncbi:hypothetical protein J41TS12_17740 [Paenibacillus antibioticophila]|uniref:Uncharacterized protein n=1 Tax=Paenibacillus antibioticophila TaxID=1274374 RepID=A0A920CGK8_9BACL|nr:hypothetical protein [Paenibacillus antibioticophila]GIO36913.1 hypothetical protein J41TS12_17740 [Paenibacillus antibioticophila]